MPTPVPKAAEQRALKQRVQQTTAETQNLDLAVALLRRVKVTWPRVTLLKLPVGNPRVIRSAMSSSLSGENQRTALQKKLLPIFLTSPVKCQTEDLFDGTEPN